MKEKDLERRDRISEKSQDLLAIINNRDGPYSSIDWKRWQTLENAARECALIFQARVHVWKAGTLNFHSTTMAFIG